MSFATTSPSKKSIKPEENTEQLTVEYYFPTPIYSIMKPEYLDTARTVANEYIALAEKENKTVNEIYPVQQTNNFYDDARIKDLSGYILNVAWDILNDQGYDMTNMRTFYNEFWCQDHRKHSGMDQHVHGFGAQIVGFYFLDCPVKSSKVLFHDPKTAKVQINLPETDMNRATPASNIINYDPKPGQLILTNAWLAHSFTRSGTTSHMKFIHFTITPQYVQPSTVTFNTVTGAAEVI